MKTSRRAFLSAAALAGAGLAGDAVGMPSTAAGSVRFCAFADIHYAKGDFWPNSNYEWIDRILDRAVKERVDFVIHLGDMVFYPREDRAYVERYNAFDKVKTYHVLGNHEFEHASFGDVAPLFGLPKGYGSFDCKGFRFIVLDPHYHEQDGKLVHFDHHCSYPKEMIKYIVPPEQMDWLKRTIDEADGPCVVLAHERFDNARGRVYNHREIRKVLTDANAKMPGKIRLVINGHHHRDHFHVLDGIPYLDLNSASYDIEDVKHAAYPESFCRECGAAPWLLKWNDPLSAIITLTDDGGLRIDGSESSYYLGVTPEMAGWSELPSQLDRPTRCRIQSIDLKMSYSTKN